MPLYTNAGDLVLPKGDLVLRSLIRVTRVTFNHENLKSLMDYMYL